MTKNIFITAVAVLLSVALCPLWAQNVKTVKWANFPQSIFSL